MHLMDGKGTYDGNGEHGAMAAGCAPARDKPYRRHFTAWDIAFDTKLCDVFWRVVSGDYPRDACRGVWEEYTPRLVPPPDPRVCGRAWTRRDSYCGAESVSHPTDPSLDRDTVCACAAQGGTVCQAGVAKAGAALRGRA